MNKLNNFTYKVQLEKINSTTRTTWLKSQISYHMSNSNTSYKAHNFLDIYDLSPNSKIRIKNSIYHLKLFRAAVDRYIKLKGSTKGLPQFAIPDTFNVHLTVDIETAYKIIKDYNE